MTKEDKKNAYLYCKFRDEQFSLYNEYAKRNGMMMKMLLVVNVLYYAETKQTVHLIIKHFLDEDQVTVTEDAADKRVKIVCMTDKGRAHYGKVVRHITWAEDTAMAMFSPEEQKTLIDLSRRFTKNLIALVNQETEER